MSATNVSPLLVPLAPVRNDWRGWLAGWLARMAARRQRRAEEAVVLYLANRLSHDCGLPPGPAHDDHIWGARGLLSR
jgi:hypothetical protein